MNDVPEKTKERTAVIAGFFAVITALIGGLFLLLNTWVQYQLSLPTPTKVAIVTPTIVLSLPSPTKIVLLPTQQPSPNPILLGRTTGNPLMDSLIGCGGIIVFMAGAFLVSFVTIHGVSLTWRPLLSPVAKLCLAIGTFSSAGAFLGSLFEAPTAGTIIGIFAATLIIWKFRAWFREGFWEWSKLRS